MTTDIVQHITNEIKTHEQFEQLWELVKQPGAVVEVRALLKTASEYRRVWTGFGTTITGYFDDPEAFAKNLQGLEDSGRATSIYVTLNPVHPDLAARAYNRLIAAKSGETTSDDQIVRRAWLLIDCDPIRPSGISATDEELAAAIERANEIAKYLHGLGWPQPMGARSGNGIHLLYRIDLPNNADARQLVSNVLNAIQLQFGDSEAPGVAIDTSVHNAARITKAYGTSARKGDNLPNRPHRPSYIESVPSELEPVSPSLLADLAAIWTGYQAALKAEQDAERETKRTGRPGDNVIAIFNERNPIEETLSKYGYAQSRRPNRWDDPRKQGSNGVLVDKAANKAYANSNNDPMHNGHRFDPFDLFTQYEHGGDRSAAYKAAKQALGLWEDRPAAPALVWTNGNSDKTATAPATPQTAGEIMRTDLGNARRMVAQHGKDLRFVYAWNKWLVWNGARWEIDETGEVERRAKQTVASIYHEASNCDDEDERKALAKWAIRSESKAGIANMIALAKSEPGIPARHTELDADPWRLNVRNGTINLQTGEIQPHDRKDLITKMAPVDYDLVAKCPQWLTFLDRIFAGDKDLIAFVRRAVGYSLTARTTEQKLFFAYGSGRNGKSTFFETLAGVLGEYWQKAPTEMIMARQQVGIPNDVARLLGARMVVCAEVEDGQRLAESKVKDLTGGDRLVARFMHAEFFEFDPTHKLWLYGNHKPIIAGTDTGIWRRICLIPFVVTIPESEVNDKLTELLLEEAPGILAWALGGCMGWQQTGLNAPSAVTVATQEYKTESDQIGAFLADCTVIGEWARVRGGQLYKSYTTWCEQSGEKPVSNVRFGRSMAERGFKKATAGGGFVTYEGVGLREDDSEG